jgi:hypothetical protein
VRWSGAGVVPRASLLCVVYTNNIVRGLAELKKISLRGAGPPLRYYIKKKTFSHRSRKSPNLYPTHTQWHRNTLEVRVVLDLCFGVGLTRRFFYNSKLPGGPSGALLPHICASAGEINSPSRTRRCNSLD